MLLTSKMEQQRTVTRREFYAGSESTSFIGSTTVISSGDTIDACYKSNGHAKFVSEVVERKAFANGIGATMKKSFSHQFKETSIGSERKSFIQQRVERLYGPGALAQGFFIR